MKIHLLPEEKMRELGFTDHRESYWCFCKIVYKDGMAGISFNISINKNDPEDYRIDVLDENFLQPYDYQYFLSKNVNVSCSQAVKKEVDTLMLWLKDAGIVSDWNVGDYI